MRLALALVSALLLASAVAASAKDVTVKVGHNSLQPRTV